MTVERVRNLQNDSDDFEKVKVSYFHRNVNKSNSEMKKEESHKEADLTKMPITKLMSKKKIKDVTKINMKMKVIVRKIKCKDGENVKRNKVHEKQELLEKNKQI